MNTWNNKNLRCYYRIKFCNTYNRTGLTHREFRILFQKKKMIWLNWKMWFWKHKNCIINYEVKLILCVYRTACGHFLFSCIDGLIDWCRSYRRETNALTYVCATYVTTCVCATCVCASLWEIFDEKKNTILYFVGLSDQCTGTGRLNYT